MASRWLSRTHASPWRQRRATIRLASGRTVAGLAFNGRSPGPELRVQQGDDVEVVLGNEDVEDGVTIHWHGVDVPNAEDGVAGVTQNAVLPGERYTYRFRAEQVGTFWYHTHQVSSKEVKRGLFGVLVIEPRTSPPGARPRRRRAHVRRNPDAERRRLLGASEDRRRNAGSPSSGQHGQLRSQPHGLGNAVPGARDRRHRAQRTDGARERLSPARSRRPLRRRLRAAASVACESRSRGQTSRSD